MHWVVVPDVIYHMIAGWGGNFISEVKLPVFMKFAAFRFVNKLIGRV
jgi:hypothetical protein